ncbi:MAG: patatin-like phospholipase family protein [Candidatus Eremiobacteraeota bacterium]|nr:patatin-like phospholipase family protein [Candidatus Eremiobacteraeota bacterium]MBV8434244.1 patatin-like phospholipase family protein [Candidatus Eremiobacteraeota bacterium]
MRALVLSGGGAHGAYEAGVASALLARERYDVICGVSIGAVNAALIAAGRTDDALERFWHDEFPSHALELFPHVPRLRRLIDHVGSIGYGNAWRDVMGVARAASSLPFLRKLGAYHKTSLPLVARALGMMIDFNRLHTSLLIGATNATQASAAVFRAYTSDLPKTTHSAKLTEYHDLTAENFVMALLASSAMPGLFSPIELNFNGTSNLYADGCIVHTSPLGLAVDNGATEVTVVFVDCERDALVNGSSLGLAEMAYNIATLWQQRLIDYELRIAAATNQIVQLGGAPGKRQITIRYVRPETPLELDMLGFDNRDALVSAFERGAADGSVPARVMLPLPVPESAVAAATRERSSFWDSLRRVFPSAAVKRAE